MIYYIGNPPLIEDSSFEHIKFKKALSILEESPTLELDSETDGINPHFDKMVMLQLGTGNDQFIFDLRVVPVTMLKNLIESRELILGQNIGFDYKFLKKSGIVLNKVYDTMIAEAVLYCGYRSRGLGLSDLVYNYCQEYMSKDERTTFSSIGSKPFTLSQIIYGAKDVSYLHRIKEAQSIRMKKYNLKWVVELENQAVLPTADIEYYGMYINTEKWKKYSDECVVRLEDIKLELDQILIEKNKSYYKPLTYKKVKKKKNITVELVPFQGVGMFEEYAYKPDRLTEVNWKSSNQVQKILKQEYGIEILNKEGKGTINAAELSKLKDKYTIVAKLVEFSEKAKEVSTYGHTFLDQYLQPDGRIRTSLWQVAITGRYTSGSKKMGAPNSQNLPSIQRSFIEAPTGRSMVVIDYCMDGDTKVLTSNYTYKAIKDLVLGEELIGFDEDLTFSKLRRSSVTNISPITLPSYRIKLSDGREFKCSGDHMWVKYKFNSSATKVWTRTQDLKVGDGLCKVFDFWGSPTTDTAWLGGVLDGEGTISGGSFHKNGKSRKGSFISISQLEGKILSNIRRVLSDNDIPFTQYEKKSEYSKTKVPALNIIGVGNCLKLMGISPNYRLHDKSGVIWENRQLRGKKVTITEIEYLGEIPLYSLSTSTKTFIAEGYATHNCQQEPRITAEYSKDPALLDFVLNGDGDSHSLVASAVFTKMEGKEIKVTKKNNPYSERFRRDYRSVGKTINLGLDYGKSAYSLALDLGITTEEAQEMMDALDAAFPMKKKYFDTCKAEFWKKGYILHDTVIGRKTFVPDWYEMVNFSSATATKQQIKEHNSKKSGIERDCQNYPIQGSAASMTKLALIYIRERLIREGIKDAWIVNVVHDEIVLECREEDAEVVAKIGQEEMLRAGRVFCKTVPMIADPIISKNWVKD